MKTRTAGRIRSASGTTLTAVLLADDGLVAVHVGDSRLYRRRGETFELLTSDDTVASELVAAGCLSPVEYALSPLRKRLARYLGRPGCAPRTIRYDVRPGDAYLLVTDGVLDVATDRPPVPRIEDSHSPDAWIDAIFGPDSPQRTDDATAVALIVK